MKVVVKQEAFDPWRELAAYHDARPDLSGKYGGTAVFIGTMRDFNQGNAVRAMTLEHYPGMTEKHLTRIAEEAQRRWEILDVLVIHRYGAIEPGEAIVVVAVWAVHRDSAFAACRYVIDELKTRAPFWKQEITAAGTRWVDREA